MHAMFNLSQLCRHPIRYRLVIGAFFCADNFFSHIRTVLLAVLTTVYYVAGSLVVYENQVYADIFFWSKASQ